MAENTAMLAKAAMALMLIVIFATLFAASPPVGTPPEELPPANTSLTDFQTKFSESFPVFDNPFSHGTMFSYTLDHSWDDNTSVYASGSNHSCSSDYRTQFYCVNDPDGPDANLTYLWANKTSFKPWFLFNLTSGPADGVLQYGTISVWCRYTGSVPVNFYVYITNPGPSHNITLINPLKSTGSTGYCSGSAFSQVSIQVSSTTTNPLSISDVTSDPLGTLEAWIVPGSNWTTGSGQAQISTVQVSLYISSPTSCSGADFFSSIGCAISQFFTFIVNGFMFLVNGLAFIAQVVVWFLSMVAGLVSLFVNTILWMGSIPGTPQIVGYGVIAVIVMLLSIVILSLAALVRGHEG